MLRRLLTLILKELQVQLRDPQGRRLLIMPIVLQLLLFPFAATLEVKNNVLAVRNMDNGPASIELIQRFSKARAFPVLLPLYSSEEVKEVIDNQRALLVVEIPEDFSRNLANGQPAKLQTLIDGRRSNAAQVASGYIQQIVSEYLVARSPVATSTIETRHWFNANLDSKWWLLPSLVAIITTLGFLIVTALSVAREREQGTFEQLLVSPLTPLQIMAGKAGPAILIATFQASIILIAAVFAYRIPFQGSLILLYLSILLYGMALVGIGLLISSICQTQQQAFLGVFFVTMPMTLLSGFTSPIENMPEPLRSITWINPVRHFIKIARGLYLKGFDAAQVWTDAWPLLVIATITLSLAYFFFSRRTS